ncbi:ABC transporter ATP-binding protein [Acetomicrobium sp. S15 = DSM 107314]|jgi:branched-chain amino acid transport system ATP-binding protein|uniref:ABC transporter ATP-binding protein n=1 Tax=Acetomicrobium sp. S15 = DSM 107314 TaxID=2529858 RepID=UPI0018E19470|nr:ABC transporter ATP-binding protein [Acetomicrobium sp. S15 = DSM 107314]
MTGPILKVTDMCAGYGSVPVLHGISLEVCEGELVAIVGANGAGKTTTMRTIAGLMRPTRGNVEFYGEDVTGLPAHVMVKKGLTYVPEGRRLFQKLSVRENLELGAFAERNRDTIEERLARVYDLFPILKERSGQKAETMSGGEQQMLAIARGLMSAPKLILLDELSLGLQPSLVERVLLAVTEIRRFNVTVLMVEQRVLEALEIADRGYVIQSGRVVMSGPSGQLLNSEEVKRAYLGI